MTCFRRWDGTSCYLLAEDTWYRIFLRLYIRLSVTVWQMLKYQWWLREGLICTPSYPRAMYTLMSEYIPRLQTVCCLVLSTLNIYLRVVKASYPGWVKSSSATLWLLQNSKYDTPFLESLTTDLIHGYVWEIWTNYEVKVQELNQKMIHNLSVKHPSWHVKILDSFRHNSQTTAVDARKCSTAPPSSGLVPPPTFVHNDAAQWIL